MSATVASIGERILYEDQYLLVVHKSAGVDSQSAAGFSQDMVSLLKNELARKGVKKPYIGVVHRLDKPVEGLLVYAKTPEMTAALSEEIAKRNVHKVYCALVEGDVPEGEIVLKDQLYIDHDAHKSFLADEEFIKLHPGVARKEARLSFHKTERGYEPFAKAAERIALRRQRLGLDPVSISQVEIQLETGRFHQIRCQLSHYGYPILGDRRYGSGEDYGMQWPALCAVKLAFRHPKTGKMMEFSL